MPTSRPRAAADRDDRGAASDPRTALADRPLIDRRIEERTATAARRYPGRPELTMRLLDIGRTLIRWRTNSTGGRPE